MKLTTRLKTFGLRLKMRLISDEILDTELDLVQSDHTGPAFAPLTRNLFRLMDTRDIVRRQLGDAGVYGDDQEMGNVEMLLAGLLSVLAVLGIVALVAAA